jgi:hypothetical protein
MKNNFTSSNRLYAVTQLSNAKTANITPQES